MASQRPPRHPYLAPTSIPPRLSASPEPSSSSSSLAISLSNFQALPKGPQETSASSSRALMSMPRDPASSALGKAGGLPFALTSKQGGSSSSSSSYASGLTSESSSLFEVGSRLSTAGSSGPGSGQPVNPDEKTGADSPATSSPGTSSSASAPDGYLSVESRSASMSIDNGSSSDVEMSWVSGPDSGQGRHSRSRSPEADSAGWAMDLSSRPSSSAGVVPMDIAPESRPSRTEAAGPEATPLALQPPTVTSASSESSRSPKASRPSLTRTQRGREWISNTKPPFLDPNPSTQPETSPASLALSSVDRAASNISSPTPTLPAANAGDPIATAGEGLGSSPALSPSMPPTATSMHRSERGSALPSSGPLMERTGSGFAHPAIAGRFGPPEAIPLPASPALSSSGTSSPTHSATVLPTIVIPPPSNPLLQSDSIARPFAASMMGVPTGPSPAGPPLTAPPVATSNPFAPLSKSNPSTLSSGLAGPGRVPTGTTLLSQKRRNRPFSAGGPTGPMKLNLGGVVGFASPVDTPVPPSSMGIMTAEERERWKAGLRSMSLPQAGGSFFDNIRQDSESLSLNTLLSNLAPLPLPPVSQAVRAQLPRFLSTLLDLTPLQRMERLAREFFSVEKAEQDRLHAVMSMHASDSSVVSIARAGDVGDDTYGGKGFGLAKAATSSGSHVTAVESNGEHERWRKFGIAAGVELGEKNRYKNIWPFEHSRVRLPCLAGGSDYINASHVALRGSTKRFIASQAPLASTYEDFWNMVWDQRVGVVVMITLCREAGREKCGQYFEERDYGPWAVKLLEGRKGEKSLADEREGSRPSPESQSYFTLPPPEVVETKRGEETTHLRSFALTKKTTGEVRRIRHVQYVSWPDFDVPPEPADVVKLVKIVDDAQRAYVADARTPAGPVLVHCSAGVGRTGSFIIVSSLLDVLQRQRQALSRPPPPAPATLSPGSAFSSLSAKKRLGSRSLDLRMIMPSPPATEVDVDPFMSATLAPSSIPADAPPLMQEDPIVAAVEEMREQRMSMVANLRQYGSVYEAVLAGVVAQIEEEMKVADGSSRG